MTDWAAIASVATAGGTLVLAVATFSSVKSANRAARAAERSLLAGLQPVLIPAHEADPAQKVGFVDDQHFVVPGHGAIVEERGGVVYLVIALRNAGSGLAVIHGWHVTEFAPGRETPPPDEAAFTRQTIDLYLPAGDYGYWLGAIREAGHPNGDAARAAARESGPLVVDLLFGDMDGGQRTIARFGLPLVGDTGRRQARVVRYWHLDREAPRN